VELRHLRYFLAVAEHLHFGRAAETLGIRQPPLSQQIQALEAELGVALFDRSARQVRLTAAGEAFRPDAQRAVDHAGAATRAAQRASRGETGHLVVGFVGSAALTVLPPLLRAFRDRYPDVTLDLRELTTAEQAGQLRAGRLDIGLLRPPVPEPHADGLHVESVGRERLVAALPAGHRLARTRGIALVRLAHEPFVLFPRRLGPGLRDQIDDYCRSAGFTPTVVQEAVQMQTILGLVAAGLGVSLVPSSLTRTHRDDVTFHAVHPAAKVVDLALAHRNEQPSAPTLALARLARDLARARPQHG
jgi:DNA-binding transcriptional LysR family regulator